MKRLLVLTLATILLPVGACTSPVDDCGPFPDKFKTTGFATSVQQATFSDSLGVEPMLAPTGDTLRTGHLAVQMRAEKETYISRRSEAPTLQFLSSAYACSPILPTSDEVIQDIEITSSTAFGEAHPAGDDLSALFDVVVFRRSLAYDEKHGYQRYDLNEFLERDPPAAWKLILVLDATPPTTTRAQFTVEYEQDGKGLEHYEFTTESVVVTSEKSAVSETHPFPH